MIMRVLLLASLALHAASAAAVVAAAEQPSAASSDSSELEDPELGWYNHSLAVATNETESSSGHAGRLLAEAKKPKRKYCNTSAYGLKGDYAYEACGAFCKQAKAVNHCKFCKCRACTFCASVAQKSSLGGVTKRSKGTNTPGVKAAKKGLKQATGQSKKEPGTRNRRTHLPADLPADLPASLLTRRSRSRRKRRKES